MFRFLYICLILASLFSSQLFSMEGTQLGSKRAKVDVQHEEAAGSENAKSASPQRILHIFNNRIPMTRQQAESIHLARLTCRPKNGPVVSVISLSDLSLSSNGLVDIPQGFSELTNLQKLSLESNNFEEIPAIVCSHTSLTDLDISHNYALRSFPVLALPRLAALRADSIRLREFPPCLGNHPLLTSLILSSNELTTLTPALFRLVALKVLDLSSNQITHIPHEIKALVALRELHISRNQLKEFPDTMGTLPKLKNLFADSNRLTSFGQLVSCVKLQILHLRNNNITDIPANIHEAHSLQTMELDENPVEEIPYTAVSSMYSLATLSLKKTPFAERQKEINELQQKRILMLGQ